MAFEYISSFLILLSYYIQSKNVYGDLNIPKYNKDVLEHQITFLAQSLDYKYIFWMFQYTVFAITLTILFFKHNNYMFFLYFITFTLFIQYLLEKHFIYRLLKKYAREKLSIKEIMLDLESNFSLIKQNLNHFQFSQIDYVKDSIVKGIYDKELISSFILGCDSNREWKKDDFFVNIYNDKGELLKLDLESFEIFKVKERPSSYLNHLYDTYSFNRIYVYGLIEPFILSIAIIGGTL